MIALLVAAALAMQSPGDEAAAAANAAAAEPSPPSAADATCSELTGALNYWAREKALTTAMLTDAERQQEGLIKILADPGMLSDGRKVSAAVALADGTLIKSLRMLMASQDSGMQVLQIAAGSAGCIITPTASPP